MSSRNNDIVEAARRYAADLLRYWLPTGKLVGGNWRVGNIHGEAGDSLSIDLQTGQWVDFADAARRGSNLVALYAAMKDMSFADAVIGVAHELEMLGLAIKPETPSKRDDQPQAIVPVPADASRPTLEIGAPHPSAPEFSVKGWWEYQTAAGETLSYVVRFDHASRTSKKGKPEKKVLPLAYFGPEKGWLYKGTGLPKNPLYRLPALAEAPSAPVLLVEGEKACEAAAALFDQFVAVCWLGGIGQLRKADFSPLAGRQVAYWPDADEQGAQSIPVVIEALRAAEVAELRVVKLPLGLSAGWDLADPVPEGVDVREILDAAPGVDLSSIKPFHMLRAQELVERLIFNAGTEQFIDPPTGLRLGPSQIDALFRHAVEGRTRMPTLLLENPRLIKVIAFTYQPGVPEPLIIDGSGRQLLNLWRPSSVAPTPGDASIFIDHLRYLCPTEEEFELLADCLAFMIQFPGEKLKFAPVLVGMQGTGKSAVASIMCRLLGEHNTTTASTSEIRSDFNEWVAEKQLVVVEEIMALGRIEVMNNLKPLITERRISVNIKHVRRYEIENKANFIFLTNHTDALRLEDDDRRYFVIASSKPPMGKDYYKAFFSWAENNLGVILHWLQTRDLSQFNPNERPPLTAGKREMIELGRDPRQRLIEQMVADREPPFDHDLIEIGEAVRILTGAGGAAAGLGLSRPMLQKYLKSLGGDALGQRKAIIKGQVMRYSLWAIRELEKYTQMTGQLTIESYLGRYEERQIF